MTLASLSSGHGVSRGMIEPDKGVDLSEHLGLMHAFARRSGKRYGLDYRDILGPCYMGLAEAARRWNPLRGRFSTCAYLWMFRFVMESFKQERGRRPMGRILSEPVSLGDDHLDIQDSLDVALAPLDDQERFIVMQRVGLGLTSVVVGGMIGLSKQRVDQIRNKALRKSRVALGISA